jgi:hypothetical protein
MYEKAQKTLDAFFAIPKEQISADLKTAEHDFEAIHERSVDLRAIDYKNRTPQMDVQIMHLTMVQASELCRRTHVEPEYQVAYAAHGANSVAEEAHTVAHNRDSLKEIGEKMQEIQKREGLTKDHFWFRNEGPEDHQKLSDEYDQISEKILDTVFVETLHRYGLSDQASLYETDRVTFEIHREVGRRLIFDVRDDNQLMNGFIAKEYGEGVALQIAKRVGEIRRKRNL